MYSFFVLGQIPGTSITITFTMWAELCAAIAASALLVHVHRKRLYSDGLQPTIAAEHNSALAQLTH